MNPQDARAYLIRRWNEQCERFPLMRDEIPLELYLRRNLKYLVHSRYKLRGVENENR